MKNIKKLVVALLCVLLCAVMFTACQNPEHEVTPGPTGGSALVDKIPEPEEVVMQKKGWSSVNKVA